jgi:hypothetical protein
MARDRTVHIDCSHRHRIKAFKRGDQLARNDLLGRSLPHMVILTQSSFGSASRSKSKLKSLADMLPSPNSSSIGAFQAGPLTITIACLLGQLLAFHGGSSVG